MAHTDADTKFSRLKWRRAFDRWRGKAALLVIAAKGGFDPNQPRVPVGNPDGGQWTSGSGSGGGPVLSDANPDNFWKPGTQLAQARGPGRGSTVRIGNRRLPATPGQAARFEAANRRAKRLTERVQNLDSSWKPRPSLTDPTSVNGAIAARRGEAREAEAQLRELAKQGLGPGPFAKESVPARSPSRSFRVDERNEINKMGYRDGCHTCGSREPGTPSGNFIPDHQLPTALNPRGQGQRLFPQCRTCSNKQGGYVGSRNRKR